jgi:hypothetical protein
MIDTQAYQHAFDTFSTWRYNRMVIGRQTKVVNLPSPDGALEGRARTRGWVCFDALPKDVLPARIIYHIDVSDPPGSSGVIGHTEKLEFIIPERSPVLQLRASQSWCASNDATG